MRPSGSQSLSVASGVVLVGMVLIVVGGALRLGPPQKATGPGVAPTSTIGGSGLTETDPPVPTATSAPSAAVDPGDLATFAWFDIDTNGPCPPSEVVDGLSACNEPDAPVEAVITLEAASLDGRYRRQLTFVLQGVQQPADLDRAHPTAFLGPESEVIYTANDGRGGALRSVDLDTGADVERFQSATLIQAAAYDTSTGTVIASMVAPDDRVDQGIWRIDIERQEASLLVGPRADLDFSVRQNGWTRRVFVSTGSALVVSLDCLDFACEARVYDPKTGAIEARSEGLRDEVVFGTTDQALIGVFDCPTQPCRISAVDLTDGTLTHLVSQCSYALAALADSAGNDMLLGVAGGAEPSCDANAVLAVEVDTGRSRSAWTARSETERQLQIIQRGPGLGYSAPSGWIALGPGGGFQSTPELVATPMLLDLASGRTVALATR